MRSPSSPSPTVKSEAGEPHSDGSPITAANDDTPSSTPTEAAKPSSTDRHFFRHLDIQKRVPQSPSERNDQFNMKTHTPPLDGVEAVPVFHPSLAQFQDPLAFIESVRAYGEQFGAIKVVPPKEWEAECNFDDLNELKFRTVTQSLTHTTRDYDEKVRFYKDLVAFHHKKYQSFVRLPSIDKRVVDLYKLHQSVNAKGGFSTVCSKKQWAQIGRELGYTGRTMTSLSTSLKVAYLKVLHSYDEYLKQKSQEEPSEEPNDENKRPMETNGSSATKDDSTAAKQDDTTQEQQQQEKHQQQQQSPDQTPRKKFKFSIKPPQISKNDVSYISNSRTVYHRPRDVLKSKGFRTNFESFTEEVEGITDPDLSTYDFYDFNFWHQGIEVIDTPFPGSDYSSVKNFIELYDSNSENKYIRGSSAEKFMTKFWDTLREHKEFKVETAHNLPTSVFGSGFRTVTDSSFTTTGGATDQATDQATDPWNLNNLPLHKDGILRYLSSDQELLTKPRLHISSLYSAQSYSMEDHFLHHVDYHHMGAPKVWYFIGPKDRVRYEEILSRCLKEYRSNRGGQDESNSGSDVTDPIAMDIMEGLYQEDQFDIRSSASNPIFDRFYEHKPSLIRFNSDLLIQPKVLKEHGINLRYAVQEPGEFIIKWPRCYSSTVSMGASITESVPLAPKSWLSLGLEAEKWLWKQGLLPAFSYYQLLCNIVEESRDADVLKTVQPHFDHFVLSETKIRSELKSLLGGTTKIIPNKFDYICDDSLAHSFPTKVVLKSDNDTFIVDPRRLLRGALKPQDLTGFKVEIHVFHTDEKLRAMQRSLATSSQTPSDWLEKFNSLLFTGRLPPLKTLKTLHSESERICADLSEAQTLAQYLDIANNWVDRAQELLNAKQKNRVRNRRTIQQQSQQQQQQQQIKDENIDDDGSVPAEVVDKQYDLELLETLIEEIPSLTFTCPEIDQILELADEVQSFEITARTFLTEAGHTAKEFSELVDLGKSFGAKLQSVELIDRILSRWNWIDDFDQLMKSKDCTLEEAIALLDKGYDICGSSDVDKLESLRSKVIEGQKWSIKVGKELSEGVSIDQLTKLIDMTEGVPLEGSVSEKLKDAKDKQIETLGVLSHISSRCGRTQEDQLALMKLISAKRTDNFDSELYDKLILKFSGDDKDKRPMYHEVKELFEKSQEYSSTTNSSVQTFFEIQMGLEAVETWQKMMKKIFGKVNAPVHLLKNHLETLNEKIMHAFAVSDNYETYKNEEDHVLFCFCRRSESGTMVACEKCDEWYHCRCLKFARGKSREVDNYICPLCDYRIEIPKEYNTPNVEELQQLLEAGALLKFSPDELSIVYSIWSEADGFRGYLKSVLEWDGSTIIGNDINLLKFYLRKLEGASVLLADEYNQLKQLIWKLDPYGDGPPPIIAAGNKTKKKKQLSKKGVKDENNENDDTMAEGDTTTDPPLTTNGNGSTVVDDATPSLTPTPIPRLFKIPIIQPVSSHVSSLSGNLEVRPAPVKVKTDVTVNTVDSTLREGE